MPGAGGRQAGAEEVSTLHFPAKSDTGPDMAQADLIRQLREYRSRWPGEAGTVDRFIDFVSSHPDCFERHLAIGHVTGSAWVVDRAGARVLLTHHKKLDLWVQLGGHADGDSDVLRVARREAAEESGLAGLELVPGGIFDVDVHRIPAGGEGPEHFHWDIRYAFRAAGGEAFRVSAESHELRWVGIQSLASVTAEESMLRMARKWRRLWNPPGGDAEPDFRPPGPEK